VLAAAEDDGWGIVIGRGQRQHSIGSRRRIHSSNLPRHVRQGRLGISIIVPQNC